LLGAIGGGLAPLAANGDVQRRSPWRRSAARKCWSEREPAAIRFSSIGSGLRLSPPDPALMAAPAGAWRH
jgi:hypothetical protein